MTTEEMLAALDELVKAQQTQDDPEGYLTMNEWRALIEGNAKAVRDRMLVAKRMGRLSTRRVLREALDGRMVRVAAYRILPA